MLSGTARGRRMGRSRLGWAGSLVAPWCLAVGVLITITAEAGQEPAQYASIADRNRLAEANDPVRRAIAFAQSARAIDEDGAPLPIVPARLLVGEPDAEGSGFPAAKRRPDRQRRPLHRPQARLRRARP